ncbi:MAG: helix-turn-helix transcriptional regulator [Bacteriovoracaceae bacterium]|jgi:transcriptional regulator with XRE-family HTH domain|nr:helix-turn-helix transcriptional regulator [Bacteriovoracaceae bacterium]|tara:strand:- start:710 stop:922 length:213 start_codon:yes stop_codon:yes gene_type:complete
MSALRKRVSKNLKRIRKEQMTQEEFAEKLDVSVRYIQKVEASTFPNMKLDTLEEIARVLKVDILELFKRR